MRRETLLWALVFSVPTGVAAGTGVYYLANAPLMGLLFGLSLAAAIFLLVAVGAASDGEPSAE